ncbi:MAG: hypothetical protein DRH07_01095 [Deltaproteobacteria bacterium]|nr:MAG: hypothetical protein DRH07_01095 [Deltaproteobacteria bacterium]
MDGHDPKDLLDFPCHYQFKAIGLADDSFRDGIVAAAGKITPVPEDAIKCSPSGKGTYQSVSLLLTLHNYQQLTDIYAAMRLVAGLKMLL